MKVSERDGARVLAISAVAISFVVAVWLWLGNYAHEQLNPGEFGDMFGAATSLFTGLAFAGVILTVWLQSRELKLQRLELRETRVELAGQREQLSLQAQTLKQQLQDENFFQLLRLFRGMATSMRHPGKDFQGVDYWRALAKECFGNTALAIARSTGGPFDKEWKGIYEAWEPSLGPYFATFAELLSLIASGDKESQTKWSRILRAQLAPQEMVPVVYHGLSPWGRKFIKGYIEEFRLFRYLPQSFIENSVREMYDYSAFVDLRPARGNRAG